MTCKLSVQQVKTSSYSIYARNGGGLGRVLTLVSHPVIPGRVINGVLSGKSINRISIYRADIEHLWSLLSSIYGSKWIWLTVSLSTNQRSYRLHTCSIASLIHVPNRASKRASYVLHTRDGRSLCRSPSSVRKARWSRTSQKQ